MALIRLPRLVYSVASVAAAESAFSKLMQHSYVGRQTLDSPGRSSRAIRTATSSVRRSRAPNASCGTAAVACARGTAGGSPAARRGRERAAATALAAVGAAAAGSAARRSRRSLARAAAAGYCDCQQEPWQPAAQERAASVARRRVRGDGREASLSGRDIRARRAFSCPKGCWPARGPSARRSSSSASRRCVEGRPGRALTLAACSSRALWRS